MRQAKYILPLVLFTVMILAVCLTLGAVTGQPHYFIASVWLGLLVLVIAIIIALRSYFRLVTRLGTVSERLEHLTYLQERRYEQVSSRLDRMNGQLENLKVSEVSKGNEQTTVISAPSKTYVATLHELNARLQRTERRILGEIENNAFLHDRRQHELARLLEDAGPNRPRK